MSIQNICLVRQNKDLKALEETDMSGDGIYYKVNYNEKKVIAMIIGPNGTPYEGGFYFFNIQLTERYPFKPPKVEFLTGDGKSRMNPNLYTTGKVCLSILGTWSGPGWTTCMTITTVLLALVTVLNENPIQNEPGYENDISYRCKEYNRFIEHENIRISIINNINKPETYMLDFREIMLSHLEKNLDNYLKNIKKISGYQKTLSANIYSCYHLNEWETFIDFFKKIDGYNKYGLEKIEEKPIKIKKKCPSKKSSDYQVGFILKSEFDGLDYTVKLQKNGVKRWIIYKQ
tara:strand:+ start:4039 stop:4902 length:864 start_codon:yes stop_codon:yes gene_type:complete